MPPTMPTLKENVYGSIMSRRDMDKEIYDETHLQNDLNFDTLDRVDLAVELEDIHSIEVDKDDEDNWITAKDVFEYVERKVEEKDNG